MELTRRDFLKLCLTATLTSGMFLLLRDHVVPLVKAIEKFESDIDPLHIVWIECGDCAGDTIALTDATALTMSIVSKALMSADVGKTVTISGNVASPELTINVSKVGGWWNPPLNSDLVYVLLGLKLPLDFHQTVMPQWGTALEYLSKVIEPEPLGTAVKILHDIEHEILEGKPRPYVLVLEGSIMDEVFYKKRYGGWNSILGEKPVYKEGKVEHVPCTTTEWIFKLCRGAIAFVAVGTCAAYGGMPANYASDVPPFSMSGAASHSPSGSMGFFPDPVKGVPGFVKLYREYAHKGVLEEVWEWREEATALGVNPEKFVKTFEPALDPFYRFAILRQRPPELDYNGKVKLCVAVPGCPANGNAISLTLAALVLLYLKAKLSKLAAGTRSLEKLAELLKKIHVELPLDRYWRPRYVEVKVNGVTIVKFPLFGFRTHAELARRVDLGVTLAETETYVRLPTGCPKYVYYKAGKVKTYPADGTPYCLYSVGCKGPVCTCPWNAVGWIIDKDLATGKLLIAESAPGACMKTGAPCIGCVMPGFSDEYEPFFKPAAQPEMPPGMAETTAALATAAAVGAGAAIALRQYAKSRIEKAYSSSSGSESETTGSAKEVKQEKRGE